jgi:phosphoribosylanthranilate isomerase
MKFWANAVTNLTDGRYFAAWNADWLGFVLDSQADNYLAPNVAAGIRGWLEGPKIVGAFGTAQPPDEVRAVAAALSLDAVQVSSDYTLADLAGLSVFSEIDVNSTTSLEYLAAYCAKNKVLVAGFILNFAQNNIAFAQIKNNELFDYQGFINLCGQYDIWLHCNLTAADIRIIATELRLQGILLQGGAEDAVGLKSFDDLDEIMELIDELMV